MSNAMLHIMAGVGIAWTTAAILFFLLVWEPPRRDR